MIDHLDTLSEEYRQLLRKSSRNEKEEKRLTDIESMKEMRAIVEKIQDEVVEATERHDQAHRKGYEDDKAFLREHLVSDVPTPIPSFPARGGS